MMNNNSETITRLIDGELSDIERLNFLTSLDEEGSGDWRTLALGFLERQLITDALRKLEGQADEKIIPPSQHKTKAPRFGDWVARAALLILGLALGFSGPRLIGVKSLEIAGEGNPEITPNDALTERLGLPEQGSHTPIRGGYITANFQDGSQLIVPVSHIADQTR